MLWNWPEEIKIKNKFSGDRKEGKVAVKKKQFLGDTQKWNQSKQTQRRVEKKSFLLSFWWKEKKKKKKIASKNFFVQKIARKIQIKFPQPLTDET